MPLPASILTPADAAQFVLEASLLCDVRRSVWDNADDTARQAALDAGWQAIASTPGYYLTCATGDAAVRKAVVVEALVRLDRQHDAGAQARARLQGQGVREVWLNGIREMYGGRPSLHPATRQLLQPYRGMVRVR